MKILFHICCSNCALYPVKAVRAEGHNFTGFWFNPNIHPHEEHELRLNSLKRLSTDWKFDLIREEGYRPEEYFEYLNKNIKFPLPPLFQRGEFSVPPFAPGDKGELFPSSAERCKSCYRLRLEKTAAHAGEQGFDAFSTTLLISPYQDFEGIISTGEELAEQYNVRFYIKDYRPGFREAMGLSRELGLYRQKYCGCIFSREERNKNKQRHRGTKAIN